MVPFEDYASSELDTSKVSNSLKSATKHTQKGEYHKIYHGAKLLELIDTKKVRKSSRHCDKLFKALEEKIGEVS
ncbi:MAG: DUF4276 family protein [Candidatus Latescibacteria bacterium]|nr:DUF4276 family protein [Candidatus Latescibacterota bacterium]